MSTKEKTPLTGGAALGKSGSLHSTSQPVKFQGTDNPRALRLLRLLLEAGDASTREICDAVGCTNAPALVQIVRELGLGDTHLPCRLVDVRDRDGRLCRPGRYYLTPEGRQAVHEWLQSRTEVQS